jgi:invasion protein IalB
MTRQVVLRIISLGLGLVILLGAAARAEDLGIFGDWYALTQDEGKTKLCYMIATPTHSLGEVANRGDIGLMITHQAGGKIRDQVSVILGFEPHKTKLTKVKIDKGSNVLMRLVDGDRVWIKEANVDRQLVGKMKNGNNLIVTGMTTDGVATQDTFSLSGFTKAYAAIGTACGLK